MKAKNILVGMIAAAAIGALVGTLFAPDKGSETRRKIKDTADDLANKVKKGLRRNKATGDMEVTG
jgi:gas vesicle protein